MDVKIRLLKGSSFRVIFLLHQKVYVLFYSGGESVIEVEKDQTKEVVVLLGGLANDHVGHVEVNKNQGS